MWYDLFKAIGLIDTIKILWTGRCKTCESRKDLLDFTPLPRSQQAILMESVRLRNEFNGTDEEYKAYLKSVKERFEKAAKPN